MKRRPEELLSELDFAATPPPWLVKKHMQVALGMGTLMGCQIVLGDTDGWDWSEADYELVAASRSALPSMLKVVRTARAALQKLDTRAPIEPDSAEADSLREALAALDRTDLP